NVPCRKTTGGKVTATPDGGSMPYSYSWSNTAATAVIANLPAGTYTVTVTDAIGCSISAQLPVLDTYCPSFVYFPTGFSPNGDGVNDVLRARFSDDLDKFNLQVYNRWGELVFESNNKLDGWNGIYKGKHQSLSVYTWVARYNYEGGKTETQSGNITLVR
ncbi:MAG TPA: gliding motility-associated C-terminal domain-containing protein, partial [Chitinophagales bacterium]|nr:gliding motility-associated C-terminal domain-containing protein [Chitinophagales bacterium]